jgi:hypothetical protein
MIASRISYMRLWIHILAALALTACAAPEPIPIISPPDQLILRVRDGMAQTQAERLGYEHLAEAGSLCRNRGAARAEFVKVQTIDDLFRDVVYRCVSVFDPGN